MTLDEAAMFLGWHPDTLRRKMRNDLTLPRSKKGKEYRFIQADLENWLRADYPEPARKLLKGDPCSSAVVSGGSALEELGKRLEQLTGKGRKPLNTSSTRKRGIEETA